MSEPIKFKMTEIFSSIEGESKNVGELSTFVRTFGCDLRCSFCDADYSWDNGKPYYELTIDEIVEECKRIGNHSVTFTGGEPLWREGADELIERLVQEGFMVDVETNGAIDFTNREWFKKYNTDQVWVCVDYKSPSSLMKNMMLPVETFAKCREGDAIKFVVGSQEDLEAAWEVIEQIRALGCNCYIYLGPVWGEIEPAEIVIFLQEHHAGTKTRLQLQIQKIIWEPNERER